MEYLKWLGGQLEDFTLAVEFRNEKWITDETIEFLKSLGLAYVSVDEPDLHGLVKPVTAVTAGIAYVRFHGRNAAQWYDHKEAYERYNCPITIKNKCS